MTKTISQDWNPGQYAENGRFVSNLGLPVVELLAPRPDERILDLGCGDGVLTLELMKYGCEVVGVDSSPEMIAAARAKGLNVQVAAGHALPFSNEFDAVFSNAALHWINEPKKVIESVRRALVPGGRFVGEMGGYGNVSAIVTAIEAALSARSMSFKRPWFFPRPEEYRQLLEAGSFEVLSIELFPRPTPLPGNMFGWLETFAWPYTSMLPTRERASLLSEVVESLLGVLSDKDGNWVADYVRLRFSARKLP